MTSTRQTTVTLEHLSRVARRGDADLLRQKITEVPADLCAPLIRRVDREVEVAERGLEELAGRRLLPLSLIGPAPAALRLEFETLLRGCGLAAEPAAELAADLLAESELPAELLARLRARMAELEAAQMVRDALFRHWGWSFSPSATGFLPPPGSVGRRHLAFAAARYWIPRRPNVARRWLRVARQATPRGRARGGRVAEARRSLLVLEEEITSGWPTRVDPRRLEELAVLETALDRAWRAKLETRIAYARWNRAEMPGTLRKEWYWGRRAWNRRAVADSMLWFAFLAQWVVSAEHLPPSLRAAAELAARVGDRALHAMTRLALSGHDVANGRVDEGIRQKVALLRSARADGNRRLAALACNSLAGICAAQGKPRRNLALLSRVIKLAQAIGDQRLEATGKINLSFVYRRRGLTAKAVEIGEEVLSAITATGDPWFETGFLVSHAAALETLGELREARAIYRRCTTLSEATGDIDGRVTTLLSRARIEAYTGSPERSREILGEALQLARQGNRRLKEATIYNELANLNLSSGDLERAEAAVRATLRILNAQNPPQSQHLLAQSHRALTEVCWRRGAELTALLPLCDRTLRLYRQLEDRHGEGATLILRSRIQNGATPADHVAALADAEQACALLATVGDVYDLSRAHHVRARALAARGRRDAAQQAYEEAMSLFEHWLHEIGPAARRTRLADESLELFEDAVEFLVGDERASRADQEWAFRLAERAKGRSLIDHVLRGATAWRIPAAEARARAELESRIQKLTAAVAGAGGGARVSSSAEGGTAPDERRQELVAELAEVRSEHQRLLEEIEFRHPTYSAEQGLTPPLSLAAARQHLITGDDQALVEFLVTASATFVWVVAARGWRFVRLDLGRRRLRELVAGVVGPLTRKSRVAFYPRFGYRARLLRLSALLLPPLREALLELAAPGVAIERLILIPSGPLHELPFEILVLRAPGEAGWPRWEQAPHFAQCEYFGERYATSYATAATLLAAELRHQRSASAAEQANDPLAAKERFAILALTDPLGRADDAPAGGVESARIAAAGSAEEVGPAHLAPGRRFGPLPGTRQEAATLRRCFPGARIVDLAGAQSTIEAYREHAPAARLIHLGCHGFIDLDDAHYSGLVLAAALGPENAATGDPDNVSRDRLGTGAPECGLLLAYEIAEIALRRRPLVLITACQAGGGRLSPTEGLLGLVRAFAQAGAGPVVASLWRAADEATAELIDHFYRALAEHSMDPALALRSARQVLLEEARRNARSTPGAGRHPYYWAGFRPFGVTPGRTTPASICC